MSEHDCNRLDVLDGGDLTFRGHIAAPGYGQSWQCVVCRRHFVKIGATFIDPAVDGVPELTPEDVR